MRALMSGPPWGLDALRMEELPRPTVGPGQLLVRMRAASLNYRDLLMAEGGNMRPDTQAFVPLSDGCGMVEEIGAGVTRFAPGDRVVPMFFQRWLSGRPTEAGLRSSLGYPLPGVAAEFRLVGEEGVAAAPASLSDAQAATLPCAGLTAWRALTDGVQLVAGDAVVLQGTGGVSTFGLQFAHAAGLRTIVTSSSDDKLDQAAALGADHLVNYVAEPRWSKPVRAATAGRGADLVMEVGGYATLAQSLRAVRVGGHVVLVGILGDAGHEPGALDFNIPLIAGNAVTLKGISVGSREMFEDMVRAIELHAIKPAIGATYPWTEARAALEAMKARRHTGKIVLTFD